MMSCLVLLTTGYLLRAWSVYRALCAAAQAYYGPGRHEPYRLSFAARSAFWWIPRRVWFGLEYRWKDRFTRLRWHDDGEAR